MEKNRYYQVKSIEDNTYVLTGANGEVATLLVNEVDNNAKVFNIQDAKDGDVLAVDSKPFIYNGSKNEVTVGAYCGFNSEHKFSFAYNYVINQNITPATKEQRDLLFQKMKEAGYEWSEETHHLKKIVQKPAKWSEEDEEHIKRIIEHFEGRKKDLKTQWVAELHNKEITWLKSLKDRMQPKQEWSEEDNHEHFSELLENDNSDNIDDYAYQCAYCMSHDWIKESPTWDDVERACKLGAEWNEKHHKSAWSEEDKDFMYDTLSNLAELKGRYGEGYGNVGKCIDWLKSLKDRIGG